MCFAGATVANCNDVLIIVDIITAGQFSDQHFIQGWQGFEVKTIQAFGCGKAGLLALSEFMCLRP